MVTAFAEADIEYQLKHNRRYRLIKAGERPCSWLTAFIMRSPQMRRSISALQLANGSLTRDSPTMAMLVIQFWKRITTPSPEDERVLEAQRRVLDAVDEFGAGKIDQEAATIAGSPSISAETVSRLSREVHGGTAPGPDGIPFELWKAHLPLVASHLANVFSAIGEIKVAPAGFLDGALKSLYKGSSSALPPPDPTDIGNYRPITLLNTDYRLLGRILSSRTGSLLANAIPASQTAFLPGRLMGDNILMLQLLPSLLKLNSSPSPSSSSLPPSLPPLASRCVIAFLDFRKAYDTVRRPFLLELMRHFGVGDGLTQWFSTLLTGTLTAASVNGHHSRLTELVGGIRQGGAESCDGYLFIPWALDCWLRRCLSVGVQATEGGAIRGWYYADDGHIVLKSLDPEVVASFKEAMEVFALATNQHLNPDKTKLLPLGDWPVGSVDYTQRIHGLEVVQVASSLGVSFSNEDEPPSPDWPKHIDKFEGRCQRIAKLGLSAFGRSFAVGTYGASSLLHALEFADALPSTEATRLATCIRHLVDLNIGPRARISPHARMPGVHSQALYGSPAKGGFGLLPIGEHVNARWFMQARRFIHWSLGLGDSIFSPKPLAALRHRQALAAKARVPYVLTPEEQLLLKLKPQQPIWIEVASAILSKVGPALPVETLLSACKYPLISAAQGRLSRSLIPPGPIRRWCSALATLGIPNFIRSQVVSNPFRTVGSSRLQ